LIIRWSWTRHATYHHRFTAASTDPTYAHLTFIRIGSRADADHLLAEQIGPIVPADGNNERAQSSAEP